MHLDDTSPAAVARLRLLLAGLGERLDEVLSAHAEFCRELTPDSYLCLREAADKAREARGERTAEWC